MPSPSALACLRCGARNALDQCGSDSAACRTAAAPPNLTLFFATAPGRGLDRDRLEAKPASLWRWASFPPTAKKDAASLGEATRRCGLRLRSASAKCGPTRLARFEGLWAEPASVAPLAAIERLRQLGVGSSSDRVKDTSAVGTHLWSPPTVSEGLDDLLRTLRQTLRVQPG